MLKRLIVLYLNKVRISNPVKYDYMWTLKPDASAVWEHDEVKRKLYWYRKVMEDEKPAKFLICKKIGAPNIDSLDDRQLWLLHDKLREEFLRVYRAIDSGKQDVNKLDSVQPNFLEIKIALADKILEKCTFCERKCSANRKKGEKGFCRVGYNPKVNSWFHHFGEEAPIVGEKGSGTIFFAGCNFGPCVFCQNWYISSDPENGATISPKTLALISAKLRSEGAANINYVGGEPTPNLSAILHSMQFLEINVPQLWNSNMYCTLDVMKLLAEVIDIWLPDFKFGNDKCAKKYSKINNYFEIVSRNHKIAHDNGDMIIRHLVLPGHTECCTKPILRFIAENLPHSLVNIMDQYHPDYKVQIFPEEYKEISKNVSKEEIEQARSYAKELNIAFEHIS